MQGTDAKGGAPPSWTPFVIASAICFVLAAGVMGYWVAEGKHFVTQYEVATEVTEVDEFGDEMTRTVLEEKFQFGLMPDKWIDAAAPLALAASGAGVGFLVLGYVMRRRRR